MTTAKQQGLRPTAALHLLSDTLHVDAVIGSSEMDAWKFEIDALYTLYDTENKGFLSIDDFVRFWTHKSYESPKQVWDAMANMKHRQQDGKAAHLQLSSKSKQRKSPSQ